MIEPKNGVDIDFMYCIRGIVILENASLKQQISKPLWISFDCMDGT